MNSVNSCRVHFLPSNRNGIFAAGTTVLEAARQLGLSIEAVCGGAGICGKCRVVVRQGNFPQTESDLEYLDEQERRRGVRLACQARITEDCRIYIPETGSEEAANILTAGERKKTAIQPAVKKKFVTVDRPELQGNPVDVEDLIRAGGLSEQETTYSHVFLQSLPHKLRDFGYAGTLVTWNNKIVSLEKNDTSHSAYGIALDLGTTTVVAKLIDLTDGKIIYTSSRMNAQRAYGEDVISRISYAATSKDGVATMQTTIINLLNEMVAELAEQSGVPTEQIYEMTVAGNTVMQHFLLGVDPRFLAEMPYVPVFKRACNIVPAELGLKIHPQGNIYLFPIIGRYVGGDTSALLLALSTQLNRTWIAVDIGTNGEIVLSHDNKLYACSTAAGPAFEGAHIQNGMRAVTGAIDRVTLADGALHIHVIGEGDAKGICGSGLIDAIGTLIQAGLINDTGRILSPDDLPENIKDTLGSLIGRDGHSTFIALTETVRLTQRDIREVQLAKGAIATGIELLLMHAQISADSLDAIYLAGAFGQYIRRDMAKAIGLLPDVPEEKIHFVGNAACTGAELALISARERKLVESIADSVHYVEISAHQQFQDVFAENMMFPAALNG